MGSAQRSRVILTDESARCLTSYYRLQRQINIYNQPVESEIVKLIDLLDETRSHWKTAEAGRIAAEAHADHIVEVRDTLSDELKRARERERDAQEQILILKNACETLERQVDDYEQRIGTLRVAVEQHLKDTASYETMHKLSRLSRPLPSTYATAPSSSRKSRRSNHAPIGEPRSTRGDGDEMDFADEDNPVVLRYYHKHRRSRSEDYAAARVSNSKRTRTSRYDDIAEEGNDDDSDYNPPTAKRSKTPDQFKSGTLAFTGESSKTPMRASVAVHRKKRSVSASRVLDEQAAARRQLITYAPRMLTASSNNDLRKTPAAFGIPWTRGRAITECEHQLVPMDKLGLIRTIMGSTCAVCYKGVSTAKGVGSRCETCKINVHTNCRSRMPMPCLPSQIFPGNTFSTNPKQKYALRDVCPSVPPLIPALIIRCIYALEQNRLTCEGLYRIFGDKSDIERLLADFNKNKFIPNLALERTETIASCIKQFLLRLKEPLIPHSSYREFLDAADDEAKLINAVCELPLPNQDTLAFLCLHLQRVADSASRNKMPIENIANCLSHSLLNSGIMSQTSEQANNENKRQIKVVCGLLQMPTSFWRDYMDQRTHSTAPVMFGGTPTSHLIHKSAPQGVRSKSISRADCSALGPVSSTPSPSFTPQLKTQPRITEPLF